jgi:general secretion pathway protein J
MTTRAGEAGMTLVELLVGLALLGMISVLSLAALQGGIRLWHGADARADAIGRIESVHASLRRLLEEAVPLREADGPAAAFAGDAGRLRWVGRAPAAVMPPGLYVLDLALADGALRLGWRPHDPRLSLAAQPPAETVLLLDGIAAGDLAFFAPEAGWQPRWEEAPRLPRLVRLDLVPRPASRWTWPPLVIAVGATVDGT